jgi:hypothetical protein
MLQDARPLSDSQLDARPVLDGRDKDFSRLVEVVAGVQQGINMHAVPAPRFDLVEVAQVGVERIVGLFVGPIAHDTLGLFIAAGLALASGVLTAQRKAAVLLGLFSFLRMDHAVPSP